MQPRTDICAVKAAAWLPCAGSPMQRRDGESILAVIRGSAVTHNGFSSGLTAPNPDSQQLVIRKALEQAGRTPADIGYLEAHGTGTELGDPIEMNAAAAVLGEGRTPDDPLLVGSVKTNLGHLEAAAGIAGVIKAVLAIQNGKIPAHLNFETPNPHIAWDRIPVQVVTEQQDWPGEGTRTVGVSAFGMSGTNAHLVIESPPPDTDAPPSIEESTEDSDESMLLVLSGKNQAAVPGSRWPLSIFPLRQSRPATRRCSLFGSDDSSSL